jgi:hypothetical protein
MDDIAAVTAFHEKRLHEERLQEERYDEAFYLQMNPDVLDGIRDGNFIDGYHHYRLHGRAEGRTAAPDFDAGWYRASYPMAARDIQTGRVHSAWEHYQKLGKFRGYLPNPQAPRPQNPALPPNPFGGLWTDMPDALDTIAGRLSIGALAETDAAALTHWIEFGYLVIPQAVPEALLTDAALDIDRAYQGGFPELLFECLSVQSQNLPWSPAINGLPAKALDLHYLSKPVRDLIFAPAITRFMMLLFQRKPLAVQSLAFLRPFAEVPHQDSAYVAFSSPRRFACSWITLEDTATNDGEPTYYPGSQNFPNFLYAGKYKSVQEAMRMAPELTNKLAGSHERHAEALGGAARGRGAGLRSIHTRRGDALIWHADLAHGNLPVSSQMTRDVTHQSIMTHYCPADIVPVSFENGRAELHDHRGAGYYGTAVY